MSRTTTKKVVLSASVAAVALSAAGMGTYAAWSTSQTTAAKNVTSGTFALGLTDDTIAVTDVAPGDTIERTLTLKNNGTVSFKGIKAGFTTTAGASDLLDGTSKSIQWALRTCPVQFATTAKPAVAATTDPAVAAKPAVAVGDCADPTTQQPIAPAVSVASTNYPAFVTAVQAADFGALAKDATTYVRINGLFAAATGNDQDVQAGGADYVKYANKSAAFTVKFTATQRDAEAK